MPTHWRFQYISVGPFITFPALLTGHAMAINQACSVRGRDCMLPLRVSDQNAAVGICGVGQSTVGERVPKLDDQRQLFSQASKEIIPSLRGRQAGFSSPPHRGRLPFCGGVFFLPVAILSVASFRPGWCQT